MLPLDQFVPLLLLLSLGLVIWGFVTLLIRKGDERERGKARKKIFGGLIVSLATILLWVFTGFTQSSLGLSGVAPAMNAPSVGVAPSGGTYGSLVAYDGYRDKSAGINYAESIALPMPLPENGAPAGEARIIKTATIRLVVEDVDKAVSAITDLRVRLSGQPGNASFTRDSAGRLSGAMTIAVPSVSFDAAIDAIKKLGKDVNEVSITARDVSDQFVDLESRLRNLRAAETQFVELMKRSGKISEVLEVTRELNNTRMQIEQLQGQLNYLSNQVALSAITIYLGQEASVAEAKNEWKPLAVLKTALRDNLNHLTRFIDDLIRFLIALPLIFLKLGYYFLIVWVIWKTGRFVYAKLMHSFPSIGQRFPPPAKL